MNSRSALYGIAALLATFSIAAASIGIHLNAPPSRATASAAVPIAPATTTPDVYPVAKVVDGDTIDVLIGSERVRVREIGLDTPEIVDPRKPVQCFAKEASAKAHALLEGTYVRLEYEPSGDVLDKYGRTLAYVFLLDGTSYEEFMIVNGYGHEYTYKKSYKYQAEFKAAEKAAREAQRGFWALDTCAGNTTKPAL